MNDPAEIIEQRDSLAHLKASGFTALLTALEEGDCLTAGGRVVVAKLARRLKLSPRETSSLLTRAQAALG
jgi:hypothetical protein